MSELLIISKMLPQFLPRSGPLISDETLDVSVANWARPSVPVPLEPPGATPEERRLANIEKYEQVSSQEMADFEAAWQKDSAIQIGGRTYASDLAPLAEEPSQK